MILDCTHRLPTFFAVRLYICSRYVACVHACGIVKRIHIVQRCTLILTLGLKVQRRRTQSNCGWARKGRRGNTFNGSNENNNNNKLELHWTKILTHIWLSTPEWNGICWVVFYFRPSLSHAYNVSSFYSSVVMVLSIHCHHRIIARVDRGQNAKEANKIKMTTEYTITMLKIHSFAHTHKLGQHHIFPLSLSALYPPHTYTLPRCAWCWW